MDYVEIPWHWFLTEEDRASLEKEDEKPLPIQALPLHYEEDKGMIAYWASIRPELEALLTNQAFYIEGTVNRESFNTQIHNVLGVLGREYQDVVANTLFEILEDVYKDENQEVHSLSFYSYEREQTEKDTKNTIRLSLNVIADELSVTVIPIEIHYDKQGVFTEMTVLKEQVRNNTPRNLSVVAYLEDEQGSEVVQLIQSIESGMTKFSYEKEAESMTKQIKKTIEEDLTELEDVEATLRHIESWIHQAKGVFKAEIVGIHYQDEQALPHTYYQVAVPNTETIETYQITVDRSIQEIIQITKEEVE